MTQLNFEIEVVNCEFPYRKLTISLDSVPVACLMAKQIHPEDKLVFTTEQEDIVRLFSDYQSQLQIAHSAQLTQ